MLKLKNDCDIENVTPTLFTIGYEGLGIEEYINKLVQNNVEVLIDVRKNPFSYKFGFSKKILQNYAEDAGMEYVHIPALGIDSYKRKELKTQDDYNILFKEYETQLEDKQRELNLVIDLLNKNKRIALTCFEKKPEMCHRTRIKNYIIKQLQSDCAVVEL